MTVERIPARQVRRGDLLWDKRAEKYFEVGTIAEYPRSRDFYGMRGPWHVSHRRNTLVRVQRRGAS